MNIKIAVILIILINCSSSFGQSEELVMDCSNNIVDENAAILGQTPFGAKRISQHHLVVNWMRGSKDFIDEPPYDQNFDGISYVYCGYNPTLGMHLIHKSEYDIFTGVLVDNSTGAVMPAGQYVSFSKDKKKYFATVQPNGLDGEEWYVYTKDGQLEWKGLSGITQKHPKFNYDYFIVELSKPRWNSEGKLEAIGKCSTEIDNNKETTVRLELVGKKWEWLPKISCPKFRAPDIRFK
jgi:hypothetical protein